MRKMRGRKIAKICALLFFICNSFLWTGHAAQGNPGQSSSDLVSITISAVGDCTLGKNYKMKHKKSWGALYSRKGAGYFLKKTASLFREDDLTIANLEGVLSARAKKRTKWMYNDRIGKRYKRDFCHLGKPEYLRALKTGGVDVLTFANNHNIDYGLTGFKDTVAACKKYGMPVAYYDTLVRCSVKGINIGIIAVDQSYCSRNTAEAFLRQGIAQLKTDCQLIIACMHWGENYVKYPNKDQEYLGHLCVNLGADMVIGNHAHIIQGVERYKGRYIFYSLGNFTYGGRLIPKDADCMIAQQTFTFVDGKLAVNDEVRVIPCRITSKKNINNYQPVIRKGKGGKKIIKKINARSKRFGLKFTNNGRPSVSPETDTELPVNNDVASANEAKEVPDIIYKLLGEKR